ncbi:hypothetical protein Q9Q94_11165 [Uliginosibacterium sp. 31-16]|uniref:hypothetical protein n=1 Tax=Uliginosibacterium sp. 31-16 TaxID=3068315 RepID=UPI00273D18D1|nr:hypothetical protein [Uliginosibacterium sp. 31-16]MDP5240093.1 hypothetical protein [Uliginosibacterium sp. 31-16]
MDGVVFTKTVFGVDELRQRQMRLHPRLRTLLVMIDGKRPAQQLIKTLEAAGITEEHLKQLQDAGLIQPLLSPPPRPVNNGPASAGLLTVVSPNEVPADESSRLMSLYRIYGDMIRDAFGAKGATYQGKLVQAARISDYIALGNEIITALNRSARVEQAVAFKARVKPYLR